MKTIYQEVRDRMSLKWASSEHQTQCNIESGAREYNYIDINA